jgi:hypothetical protein
MYKSFCEIIISFINYLYKNYIDSSCPICKKNKWNYKYYKNPNYKQNNITKYDIDLKNKNLIPHDSNLREFIIEECCNCKFEKEYSNLQLINYLKKKNNSKVYFDIETLDYDYDYDYLDDDLEYLISKKYN